MKWVTKHKEDGSFWYMMPYVDHVAMKFMDAIRQRRVVGPLLWGLKPIEDKGTIWKIAQEEYENFKTELPASYLAYYLP